VSTEHERKAVSFSHLSPRAGRQSLAGGACSTGATGRTGCAAMKAATAVDATAWTAAGACAMPRAAEVATGSAATHAARSPEVGSRVAITPSGISSPGFSVTEYGGDPA